MISDVAENWRLDRMAAIDRNILRLGAYEMLFRPEVPAKVAINEALELAKRYSTAQSSRFVNGILDRVLQRQIQEAKPPSRSGARSRDQGRGPSPKFPVSNQPPMKPNPISFGRGHLIAGGTVMMVPISTYTRPTQTGCVPRARSSWPPPESAWRPWLSPTTTRYLPSRLLDPRLCVGVWNLLRGVELTCQQDGHEIHVLGHFIRDDDPGLLEATTSLRPPERSESKQWPPGCERLGFPWTWTPFGGSSPRQPRTASSRRLPHANASGCQYARSFHALSWGWMPGLR